ncbi:tetratricopeptide repeat protein 28-like isoform X2 [Lineus longissimus]|uniref:tetratricopeptide repeat protein 28-like isoform X2 n=1 Tax=Lineus longissimus TaxID=88925 RepID=UPI002B4DF602
MMKWSFKPKDLKAYYRQGIALQCMGQHAEGLAAFAGGLAQDPKSGQLLGGLVDAALKSPLKEKLGPIYQQLQKMKLDRSPFVVISVIGQELLAVGSFAASALVLESALRIGTCSLKLRGSVFSALSSAHWGLGNIDKAIAYMQQDLTVTKSLGDQEGECRAHGNLGAAFFSKGNYKEALSNHRFQLVLAMRQKDRQTAAMALSSLGHVYTAVGDYPNALASHKQCVLLVKQSNNRLIEAREIGNVGAVYLAMGDFDNAVECHNEHLKLAKHLKDRSEEARAVSNLGSAHHYKRNYDKAITFHNQVLTIAEELTDKTLEARAYAGLGHAARCMQDLGAARHYHEKQLDNALQTRDKVAEGRACSNLGIIYQQLGEFEAAVKLHKAHMNIAKDLQDRASLGRAYGNIGNGYSSIKEFDLAVKYHKQELAISKEVNDRHSEASTHGNLAVAYQALKMHEKAMHHYHAHLTIAQELKDTSSEARALSNLGNYHSSRSEFQQGIPYYEQYLILSQELLDMEGEGKACHKLGYAHYSLGNYREAIRYYEQDLAIAKDIQDKVSLGRAYCNLGLAHKALLDYAKALECQKCFLTITHMLKNYPGKFRALGNMGDISMKLDNTTEGIKLYNQQLILAKQTKDKSLEASAYSALGTAHRLIQSYDKALGFHNQELTIRQEINDLKGECKAHGNLGNVHMTLGNYTNAFKCYEEQLARARELQDCNIESQACGNLGITKMNLGLFEDSIGHFEQQLALLEQVAGNNAMLDKGRAFGNLGDCYESLFDFEEAVRCHEQYLAISQNLNFMVGQEKAYRGLGTAHRALGNLQQALVCFEKRLVVAHELDNAAAKGSAYGELGCLHSLLGNFEQAISCLEHQLNVAREIGDKTGEGDAACGLGGVYQQMGEYETALKYHQMDLDMAEKMENMASQCRAYGNMGLSHESLMNFEQAIMYQEQHLSIAAQMNDRVAKTLAYSSLGRVHHAIGNYPQAVQYLHQGLQIAEQLGRKEDEAKIRHRLGLALLAHGDLDDSQHQLYKAVELFETIRRDAQMSSDYQMSLFDLQTASYQALQRVLVALGRHNEALVVAERGRTRAFIDLLLERQAGSDAGFTDNTPITMQQILDIVNKQRAAILYFSIAAGYLYTWLITPDNGVVKFHESNVTEIENSSSDPEDTQSIKSMTPSITSILDQYVGSVRESLGIEHHGPTASVSRLSLHSSGQMSETESEADDLWQQHLEELGEKLNAENDRTGFLRMVNRNHMFNCSNYSLSSLFSISGSLNGFNTNAARGSTMSRRSRSSLSSVGKPPLGSLYNLLIGPMEEALAAYKSAAPNNREVVLVLQGDLYLIPFPVLKGSQVGQCLYERFDLIAVPSLKAIQANQAHAKQSKLYPSPSGALVVGNPKLVPAIAHQWQWNSLPATEHEAKLIAEMLGTKSLLGNDASKEAVIRLMPNTEVLHFSTHVSWKLSAIVLSPLDISGPSRQDPLHSHFTAYDLSDSGSSEFSSSFDGPSLSEFLLTAADILNIKLSAKLVVLSSGHTDDRAGRINSDGVVGLTRALLAAGAQCVLFALWPVPEQASRIFMKTFYTALLQGCKASRALGEAMRTVQTTSQYSHPSNWACWTLIGSDVKLSSKVALMGHALGELLRQPVKCREAMRVLLHLIEKSLQRILRGQRNAMYTTQQSIENKVGSISGWKDLLMSVGFRFEPAANSLPPAVFFPTSDPGERLTQCSASLQAMLGLPANSLTALTKMLPHYEAGEAIINLVRDVNNKLLRENSVEIQVNVKLWRVQGCHEFLASLGFDLIDVGRDQVILRLGKQANRRTLQFALTVLLAVFDTQEAPRMLSMGSSSSMDSLASSRSGSATSTSNFSKGSTPPLSPHHQKKSIFNPAEVEKFRARGHNLHQPPVSRKSGRSKHAPNVSMQLLHQTQIRAKYGSDSASYSDSQGEDNLPKVISVDAGDHARDDTSSISSVELPRAQIRQNASERNLNHGYFSTKAYHQAQYSTSSQSEGEEMQGHDGSLSRQSYTRYSVQSAASLKSNSTASTLTSKMSAFRRSHGRSSMASTRSSASDRTITNEPSIGRQDASPPDSDSDVAEDHNIMSNIDPSAIAMKVLSETLQERHALEQMQRMSIQKQAARANMIRAEGVSNQNPNTVPADTRTANDANQLPTSTDSVFVQVNRDSEHNPTVSVEEDDDIVFHEAPLESSIDTTVKNILTRSAPKPRLNYKPLTPIHERQSSPEGFEVYDLSDETTLKMSTPTTSVESDMGEFLASSTPKEDMSTPSHSTPTSVVSSCNKFNYDFSDEEKHRKSVTDSTSTYSLSPLDHSGFTPQGTPPPKYNSPHVREQWPLQSPSNVSGGQTQPQQFNFGVQTRQKAVAPPPVLPKPTLTPEARQNLQLRVSRIDGAEPPAAEGGQENSPEDDMNQYYDIRYAERKSVNRMEKEAHRLFLGKVANQPVTSLQMSTVPPSIPKNPSTYTGLKSHHIQGAGMGRHRKQRSHDSDSSSHQEPSTRRIVDFNLGSDGGTDIRTDTSTDSSNKRDSINSNFHGALNLDSASEMSDTALDDSSSHITVAPPIPVRMRNQRLSSGGSDSFPAKFSTSTPNYRTSNAEPVMPNSRPTPQPRQHLQARGIGYTPPNQRPVTYKPRIPVSAGPVRAPPPSYNAAHRRASNEILTNTTKAAHQIDEQFAKQVQPPTPGYTARNQPPSASVHQNGYVPAMQYSGNIPRRQIPKDQILHASRC